jgi:hypothetical protein
MKEGSTNEGSIGKHRIHGWFGAHHPRRETGGQVSAFRLACLLLAVVWSSVLGAVVGWMLAAEHYNITTEIAAPDQRTQLHGAPRVIKRPSRMVYEIAERTTR